MSLTNVDLKALKMGNKEPRGEGLETTLVTIRMGYSQSKLFGP